MSTQPVSYDGIGGLLPPQEFCVHNATDEPVEMRYDGETRVIPPFAAVAKEDPKHADVCFSLRGEDGEYIPGTLVLRDIASTKLYTDGGTSDRWSAAECIRHALGIDVRSRMAYGVLASKGVSFIPAGASKADVARIADAGRRRYVLWYEENASAIISAYEERNSSRARFGEKPLPPDKAVRIAQGVMTASRNRDGAAANKVISELSKIMSDEVPPTMDEDQALIAAARKLAGQMKEEQAYLGDSETLVARLMSDPVAMGIMRSKFRMKKLRDESETSQGVPIEGTGLVA